MRKTLSFGIAAIVGLAAVRSLATEGTSNGAMVALCCAGGLVYVAATQMRAPPATPIDPEREIDRTVPPKDADG